MVTPDGRTFLSTQLPLSDASLCVRLLDHPSGDVDCSLAARLGTGASALGRGDLTRLLTSGAVGVTAVGVGSFSYSSEKKRQEQTWSKRRGPSDSPKHDVQDREKTIRTGTSCFVMCTLQIRIHAEYPRIIRKPYMQSCRRSGVKIWLSLHGAWIREDR